MDPPALELINCGSSGLLSYFALRTGFNKSSVFVFIVLLYLFTLSHRSHDPSFHVFLIEGS